MESPKPVKIIDTEKAIPVIIEAENKEPKLISKDPEQILAPKTTEEQDRVSLGQRNINLIWEKTQSRIALTAVWGWILLCFMIIAAMLFSKRSIDPTKIAVVTATLAGISLTVGIIIGFYFSRTNHSAIGGTGKKEESSNTGTR